jgi:DNA polymerase-1
MTEQLIIVKTLLELNDLVDYLQDKQYISFDTETTGIEKDSNIIGLSVAAELDKAYYVILEEWNVAEQRLVGLETKQGIVKLIKALLGKSLIMQNAVFDVWMVQNNYKVDLMPSLNTDTLVLGHLLNENRRNGLKERGLELYGETAVEEQKLMKESVTRNGGVLTKDLYELYKADSQLIAKYGAKDAILTLKLFYNDVPLLYEEGLDEFFYGDETMPLLRGPTYDLNTTGLRVDPDKLAALRATLEADIAEGQAYIYKEVDAYVKKKYPGTGKTNHFNIGSGQQLAWLLFDQLGEEFGTLTKAGKEVVKELGLSPPYTAKAKRQFIETVRARKGEVWKTGYTDKKKGKEVKPKKIGEIWSYTAVGKESLEKLSKKYKWVARLLQYKKDLKLLNTYVNGISEKMRYNIIRPQFLQHGTTSGRYSSKSPNFQNLPRDDKRVKACIVSRPGKVFIGADQSQLEPRCFASQSGDERLLKCFKDGEDFYSVIGAPMFGYSGLDLTKSGTNSFAVLYPELRELAKKVPLAVTYGATAFQLARITGKTVNEMQAVVDSYFESFPKVKAMMLNSHKEAMDTGQVVNQYGRPRRMPQAKMIKQLFGKLDHSELPYELRNVLNLAVNHKVQSTGASIMNRAAVALWKSIQDMAATDARWKEVKIVLQVHDEIVLEAPEDIKHEVADILKYCMEETVVLKGVDLKADPKMAYNLADLK